MEFLCCKCCMSTCGGGFLPVGKLETNIITCSVHLAAFDVTTGKLVRMFSQIKEKTGKVASDLESFKVTIEDNSVFIEL